MFSIFKTFFLLGWVSFGGPAAHIGYFRNTFVEKLKWLSEEEYAQIVALSQFLPGPGSSQVGFAIGYRKGGITGATAAFLGFTLPSILLMLGLAILSSQLTDSSLFQNVIHGLKLLAVVVVADATIGMYRNFCLHKITIALCVATAMALLLFPNLYTQMMVLVVAALIGQAFLKGQPKANDTSHPIQINWMPLIAFVVLLMGLPIAGNLMKELQLFSDFFQAGSLVFGGGHVVLPLLQNIVGEQISQDAFLTGYAAAQAVPGPMFTFATYIGYELLPTSPVVGALLATIAVFLPGFLLLLAVLNNWQALASKPKLAGAVAGVNASVVGLLLAALYQPVFTSGVLTGADMAVVLAGFYFLKQRKLPIVALVAFFIAAGIFLGQLMA
ncbi:chromate efflux transporter [Vibrio penaeicida]|uniref:chromate efflux transporter n=1 Tax=Vibrio penaeicida TaxID=104609 RepID=UPI0027360861|nr:chromate efflux transporter [Vibrio penaeicida]MDP2572763.1 chromate efflux transporter [Vibrio penaeicida]